MKRRDFIHRLMAAGAGAAAATLHGNPFQTRMRFASAQTTGNVLVVVFQRGGADGLNECVPYGLQEYYDIRPTIAIAPPDPGDPDSAIDLDGFFGFHPALGPLAPLWSSGELAIFPACHYPSASRSHFTGQRNIESGEDSDVSDGWLNRYLVDNPGSGELRAVAIDSGVPHALKGNLVVSSFSDIDNFSFNLTPAEEADLLADLDAAYSVGADPGRLTRELVVETGRVMVNDVGVVSSILAAGYTPANGASYPSSTFADRLRQTAQIIKANVGLEVVAVDLGGWDTHSNEANRLPNALDQFAGAIQAFHQDMGTEMNRVCMIMMTEFGRTSVENGSLGTDHAHAGTWMALGGGVNGGMIYPNVGGVAREAYPGYLNGLQEVNGRYLNHSLDFRDVLAEALTQHLGVADVSGILPGHAPAPVGFL